MEKAKILRLYPWMSVGTPAMPRCSRRISSGSSVKKFTQAAFIQDCTIHGDGCGNYTPVLEGYACERKPYNPNFGLLLWLHIVISNAKSFIPGAYHGLPKKYL